MSKEHVELSLDKIRKLFEKAALRIEALRPGEKIPATALAELIAKEEGMNGPQLYPTLLFLFKDYPGIEVKRGAKGGLCKLPSSISKEEVSNLEIKDPDIKE